MPERGQGMVEYALILLLVVVVVIVTLAGLRGEFSVVFELLRATLSGIDR
jgi:Flp pilus assembly pilin Flp